MSSSPILPCRSGSWLSAVLVLTLLASQLHAAVGIAVSPPGNANFPRQFAPGSSITLSATNTTAGATYSWMHDGTPIAGATSTSLTLSNLSPADGGNYEVQQTVGGVTETSDTFTVNVLAFPVSQVDTTFTSQLPASPLFPATVVAFAANGSMVVQSATLQSQPTLRLNGDGSIDASFNYPASAGAVLTGLPDGTLIVANAPYRLNADGSARPLVLPPGFDSTKPLTAAAAQPDGRLLLAQGAVAGRLKADDSVDATFNYSSSFVPPHAINGFKFDPAGRIYVSALTPNPVAGGFPSGWPVVYRLSATGAEDVTFARQTPPLLRGVIQVFPLADGRLLSFRSYETIVTWNLLLDNGSTDPSWLVEGSYLIPKPIAVDPANNRVFYIDETGPQTIRRLLITSTTLAKDPGFYAGGGSASSIVLAPSGKLMVGGYFTAWEGHPSPGLVRLNTDQNAAVIPPVVNILGNNTPVRGSTLTLSSAVTGTGPFSYQWLALDGQPMPANTTSSTLAIDNFDTQNFGRYQLRVTAAAGTVLSGVFRPLYDTFRIPYLANLSGRAFVGTGDDTAIAGMAVKIRAGALGVSTLLRGVGPALQNYGVTSYLPNPTLNLYNATGQLIANNDNWNGDAIQTAAASTGAFPLAAGSNDAALLRDFGTSNTTLQLTDQSGNSGTGLLEIYRQPQEFVDGEIINLSLRARTGPGEKVAIAGFVIVDPQGFGRSARVVLRAIGPTLSQSGVAFPLSDPVLTLYRADTIVAQNNDWSTTSDPAGLTAAMQRVGAFALPVGSKDAAMVLDLPAGVYSVQSTGAPGTPDTGVTLIEIYVVR